MTEQVNFITAFTAGLLSFISPCVLPLVPAYLSYISGVSLDAMRGKTQEEGTGRKVILNTLLFVLGFSLVFCTLGATASYIGQYLVLYKSYINIIGGIIIVVLGLHLAGVYRIKWLEYEKRVHVKEKPLGLLGSLLIGSAFAFGWTPCIGPILSAILLVAADQKTTADGIILLAVYSMGLGVPFLITGIALNYAMNVFKTIKKHYRGIELASGVLLIFIGVLVATDQFSRLSAWLARFDSYRG